MKKKLWMIIMIVLLVLFIPRYNTKNQRSKSNHGQRYPHRKGADEPGDFEFPLPGKWLLLNIVQDKYLRKQYAVNSRFIATGHIHNGYVPVQASHGLYE